MSLTKRTVAYALKETFEAMQLMDRRKGIVRNREVRTSALKSGIRHPVCRHFAHNEREVRVEFVANEKGDTFWQDMSFKIFDKLPTLELETQ